MDNETKLKLFTRKPTEEILTEEDLKKNIENDIPMKHYIGFEISGKMHLGTGIGCMAKVADFLEAGVDCTLFFADYHSYLNNKLGGNMDLIQKAAEYFKEGMIACLKALGADPSKVKCVLGSQLYHNNDDYWHLMLEVSKNVSINRIMRSITIMGRQEKDLTSAAQLIYPPMQVADIFSQGVNIAHAGIDQRKAHVIAREVGEKLTHLPKGVKKGYAPVCVHHHLLLGLAKPPVWPIPQDASKEELVTSLKMSKSKPESAIFITDAPDEIRQKIRKAFCPEKEVELNPVLDWANYLAFRKPTDTLTVDRKPNFGGPITFESFDQLSAIYREGKLHPLDLKNAVAEYVVTLLEPVRNHFKGKEHLLSIIDESKITR